jgi:hypothetical protein
MTMQVVERDAIVINNADPLGLARLQVFIYGVHDITGIKTPFENLPWAFASQTTVSIPKIYTPIKVKYKFSFGSAMRAFADQEALEWHSPSPYLKLTENRDPRLYLKYDSENQKFLNQSPVDYSTIKNKIAQLEEEKKTLENAKKANEEELKNLIADEEKYQVSPIDESGWTVAIEYSKSELNNFLNDVGSIGSVSGQSYDSRISQLESQIQSGRKLAEIAYPNRNEDEQDLTLEQYADQVWNSRELTERANLVTRKGLLERNILDAETNLANLYKNSTSNLNRVNTQKQGIQEEINKQSLKIQEIDKQIAELNSQASNAPNALLSIEQARSLDARVGRYDEASGKVYNTQEELIGNWTGYTFYLPGYALQPGPSIPDRKKLIPIDSKGRISEESYLQSTNLNGSKSGQLSTIIDPSDSVAIEKSNNDKTWNCDISYETRLKILTKRQEVITAVKWLRDKILALFAIDGNSATAQWIKQTVKLLTATLKSIQKFLKLINEIVLEIAKITAQIRQLINWILSLPARLLVLLQDCLTHFFNSLTDAFSESISLSGAGGENVSFSEVTELISETQKTFQTAKETVEITTIVYTEIKAIEATFEKV